MLSSKTIEAVKDLAIQDVLEKYLPDLKKKGAGYNAKSPFTDEKTGSFQVSPAKNCWKCFSTGKGGAGSISFVMEKEQISFVEAIKSIAEKFNVLIEYDESDRGKKYQEKQERVNSLANINAAALEFFQKNYGKVDDKFKRASSEMVEKFNLGFAPNDWGLLRDYLLNQGFSNTQMENAGLIKKGEKGYYDFFRGRVIFPIQDIQGKIIGFSGRLAVDGSEKDVKCINSKDTDAYDKSSSLLGLFQAKNELIKTGAAIKVEGNYDVTSMHQTGFLNTVGTLGTAFTEEHAKLVKKFCKTLILAVDNDKAGLKSIEKDTKIALTAGLNVELFIPPTEGHDPDDWCKNLGYDEAQAKSEFKASCIDAIDYLDDFYFKDADTTVKENAAEQQLVDLLTCISDATLRNKYVAKFVKTRKLNKAHIEKSISISLTEKKGDDPEVNGGTKLPGYLTAEDLEDWNEFGFFEDRKTATVGYYFPSQGSKPERVSNFIMKPLFLVFGMQESKRLVEIQNHKERKIIELSDSALVSKMEFDKITTRYGNYWFHGMPKHFQRVKVKLLERFPFCVEIRTLGWNPKGFFAFSNGIVMNNAFKEVDTFGIVDFESEKYFLPAFSSIYKDMPSEDDFYKNDRKFIYKTNKKNPINFQSWAAQFYNVYKDNYNGAFAILYSVATLFSDYIFSINNDFPMLFMFGLPRTGKTTCAWSLSRVFKPDASPFDLNAGTIVAFQRILSGSRNTVVHLDEYQNDLDEKKFQNLKGIYNRNAAEKGKLSRDNRTESTEINNTAVISGQYLPTRDGNSLFTRSILLNFSKLAQDFTADENKLYNDLSQMEKQGLSFLIVEVLRFRSLIEEEFNEAQIRIVSQLKDELQDEIQDGRVLKNFAVLIACMKVLDEKLKFPFSFDFFYKKSKEMIIAQSQQIQESDQLAEFFKMIEFLSFQHQIHIDEDYKVEIVYDLKIGRKDKAQSLSWKRPKKLLFINFTKVIPLYKENVRKQGESPLREQDLISYLKSHKAFVGAVAVCNFKGKKTSAYALDFDMLGISLKGFDDNEIKESSEIPNPVIEGAQEDLPF